jgi:hypothetical protein
MHADRHACCAEAGPAASGRQPYCEAGMTLFPPHERSPRSAAFKRRPKDDPAALSGHHSLQFQKGILVGLMIILPFWLLLLYLIRRWLH